MSDDAPASPDGPPAGRPSPRCGVRVPVGDLAPGSARVFTYDEGDWEQSALVVNHEGRLYVYVNRCPHVPYTLDFGDGEVMSFDRTALMCSNHGAHFDPATGRCFAGPPIGKALSPLPFERDGDDVIVDVRPNATRM